jgi:hypothetical protein
MEELREGGNFFGAYRLRITRVNLLAAVSSVVCAIALVDSKVRSAMNVVAEIV